MDFETLLLEKQDGVATLNRPEHLPTALALTKQCIWEGLDDALENTWKAINEHTRHPDLNEGTIAFVEKRKPRWTPYTG